jgi:hypothetical protein
MPGVVITGGDGKGIDLHVTEEHQAKVVAEVHPEISHHSRVSENAYSWTNATYNYTAADTILAVKNTSATKNLYITKIEASSDATTNVQVHIITASYTDAGTAVTGVNMNANSTNVADATAYGDETGNTQGNIVAHKVALANTTAEFNFDGALILGRNQAVGVDFVTVGAACYVTIYGFYA